MRKMKIGIFAVFTAILFILSTSTSVTAIVHRDTYMHMTSNVHDESPWASVYVEPQNIGAYSNWTWTIDINDGDDIRIDTTCYYNNYYSTSGEGYHYFYMAAVYVKGMIAIPLNDWHEETTWDSTDSGSTEISVTHVNVEEDGVIEVYWYVQAINIAATPDVDVDFENSGTIYLT